ncbi:hypothetical protein F5Y18DRAFT_430066 [Xylariaceae sp. FL1019]|nr:hypothetical protein F5Y18DRAFT_430066 [Xylariaceae sp. FL1019]
MPFLFTFICDLLQDLEREVQRPAKRRTDPETIIEAWFCKHKSSLNVAGNDDSAILSTLLPERRSDRVYYMQSPRLQSIFGRIQGLQQSRLRELRRYLEPGSGLDLAECIEDILTVTPNCHGGVGRVTVEEIDEVLSRIAAACRFSSPAVRALPKTSNRADVDDALGHIYLRLSARDAKWFTRLILKSYQPVVVDAETVFRNYHYLLPQIMKTRNDLSAVTKLLQDIRSSLDQPSVIANILKPQIGTKIERQPWWKGRSIKNCMNMARGREVICEQKIDGEYCQIHIDLGNPSKPIQIFSKSGKDSTSDRRNLHSAIRDSLKLGQKDCLLKTGCILEGELVVYSTLEEKILPFHKIRKHVNRSGSFLGTKNDSQPHDYEHLMVIYYDVLLIDDTSLLHVKNSERFKMLNNIITPRQGYAEFVSRTVIKTSRPHAADRLREIFAQCILARGEGIVIKPDEPYFDFTRTRAPYRCGNIKLKKEYMEGCGDVGDFAVVGASYDPATAKKYGIGNLQWTHFYIGCLEGQSEALDPIAIPQFRVTNIVELSGPLLREFWAQPALVSVPYGKHNGIVLSFTHTPGLKRPAVVFPEPLVFDMRCFAFDKEPNTNFWSMRFPQVSKIHYDRSYRDTISFTELQAIAEKAREIPDEEDSQEMRQWVAKLEKLDRRGNKADTASQSSTTTVTSLSSVSTASSEPSRHSASDHLPTPPPSSLPQAPSSPKDDENTAIPTASMSGIKRSNTGAPEPGLSPKRPRRQSGPSSTQSSQQNLSTEDKSSRSDHREPLSQVDANISDQKCSSRPLPPLPPAPPKAETSKAIQIRDGSSSPADYQTASEMRSSSPIRTNTPIPPPVTSRTHSTLSDVELPAPACAGAGSKCLFSNCSILVSPCISGYAWITEDLFKHHGITNYLLDPLAWKAPSETQDTTATQGATTTQSADGSTQQKKRRIRKICLVEPKREQATEAFIQKIEDADLQRSGGKRDWVTVYDWRVLEFMKEHEEKPSVKDPWRRFYLSIA